MKLSIPKLPAIPPKLNAAIFAFLMLTLLINGIVIFRDFPFNGNPFKWAEARDIYTNAMRDRIQFDLEHASMKLKQAINIYDGDPRFYASLGDCQLRLDQYADAQASFEKAIALDKRNVFAWTRLARALAAQGKMEEALKATHKALDVAPGDAVATAQLGLLLASSGHVLEAKKIFDDTRSLERDSAEYWCLAGRFFHITNQPQRTEAAFRQAVMKDPSEPEYSEWLGLCLQAMGQTDEAEQTLQTACQLSPHNSDYWLTLAKLQLQQNHVSSAINSLQNSVKESPEKAEALNLLGIALVKSNRFAEAEAALQSAMMVTHDDETLRGAYVTSILMQGKLATVEHVLRGWLQNPKVGNAGSQWILLGDVLGFEGKSDAARQAYKEALSKPLPEQAARYTQDHLKSPLTPDDFKGMISKGTGGQ